MAQRLETVMVEPSLRRLAVWDGKMHARMRVVKRMVVDENGGRLPVHVMELPRKLVKLPEPGSSCWASSVESPALALNEMSWWFAAVALVIVMACSMVSPAKSGEVEGVEVAVMVTGSVGKPMTVLVTTGAPATGLVCCESMV